MFSKSLIDPTLLPLLEIMPSQPYSLESLPAVRAAVAALTPPPVETSTVTCEELSVPSHSESHQVRVLVYRSTDALENHPALLEMHGGGYVFGSPEQDDTNCRQLAEWINGTVVSVDYRLAPETVFPGAQEDCYSVLAWLHNQAKKIGIDRRRIGVIGNSAGGCLAAAVALMARDRGEFSVAAQVLLMPMLDDRTVQKFDDEPHPFCGEFIWNGEQNRFGWQSMLGQQAQSASISAYAAPARADDLSNLPPAFISVGALDLFLDEDLDYAKRLIRAGVPTDLHVYAGAIHAYSAIADAESSQQESHALRAMLTRVFSLNQ